MLHPDLVYRQKLGDISKLAESMANENGMLHPICVDGSNRLLIGLRRLEAAKTLGWKAIYARIIDLDNPFKAIEDENECREPFTASEKVMLAKAIEAREKIMARERIVRGQVEVPKENFSQGIKTKAGKAKDIAAKAVGMSSPTLAKAEIVVDAAAENPELQPIVDEMDATNNVSAAHRKLKEAADLGDDPVELTFVQMVGRNNNHIEQFCLGLMRHFEANIPDLLSLKHNDLRGSALSKIRAACETLRVGKLYKEPCPRCEGGGCKICDKESDFGAVCKLTYDAIGRKK